MSEPFDGFSFDPDLIGPWLMERIPRFVYTPGTATAIARLKDSQIVAAALFVEYNGSNIFAHIAVEPGGINRQFLSLIFDYPFNQLKVRRVTGLVDADNHAARRLDEHLGFELEATLRDASPNGDLCVYALFKENADWLRKLPYEKVFARDSRSP